ncbi:hypothetical protein [Klebsiella pneumoniae]|uniref:hypothetical protein n=1 Tax=Klebsiella pneumoniae TaxID=573 RepID=UPI0037A80BCC
MQSASAADKANSAKNVVTSKIGYGEQRDRGGHEVNAAGDKSKSSMPATALNYGKKIAVAATENLTSVYGKVTGAVSTDKSKMPGTNTGTGSEKERSVKDYFAEKLKPGEEDKALSEAISEALHRKKTEKENKPASPRPVTEVISDAWQNREEEQNEATDRPMGKVTESEEVARRLDNTEHDSSKEGTNSSVVNNSDKGMVGKIKGAVGSWFGGRGEETQASEQSKSVPVGSAPDEAGNNNNNITGERSRQEAAN